MYAWRATRILDVRNLSLRPRMHMLCWQADFEECAQPGSACRRSVQAAHQRFIETYPEVAASTPILRLRVNNFTYSPFELVDD